MNTLTSIVYTVHDLAAATAVHAALLGVEPHTDTPYYVGFNVGGVEIALTPVDPSKPANTPVAFIAVADLDAAIAEVVAAGATLVGAPQQVGGGTMIATVSDPGGNTLGLIHAAK
jgi:predicted enzyme related to lactoylglutathione lyase